MAICGPHNLAFIILGRVSKYSNRNNNNNNKNNNNNVFNTCCQKLGAYVLRLPLSRRSSCLTRAVLAFEM